MEAMERRLLRNPGTVLFLSFLLFYEIRTVSGDAYLHNPRGSNNKLSEQSNNVQNANRLFDSQNNGNGGYQIGDKCTPVCQDNNQNYDATKPGAMQGAMTFYQGSELYVEWSMQHGCGPDQPNVMCNIVLQYMCEADNPDIRDGTNRNGNNNNNRAGGPTEPPTAQAAKDQTLGMHESLQFYLDCKARSRNKGLYTADQQVSDNQGATATRQNPGGNAGNGDRNGLECPEERDYYPYWHPSPWHDIAILTDEPQIRCAYYRNESQNVQEKGYCSNNKFNNPKDCTGNGGSWQTAAAFKEPPPDCVAGASSRDNHNGNSRGVMPNYYLWKIPNTLSGRCVFRLRYNITTKDFADGAVANSGLGSATSQRKIADPFFVDSALNDPNPGTRRRDTVRGGLPILSQDPKADWLGLGDDYQLQLQVNTNQYGRTFEDRSHTFFVTARPSDVGSDVRIVNFNVRGKRGNIEQVYPAVEYDFVPQDLKVEAGTMLHMQWTGSDAHPQGNPGNGRAGTDRSNLVQISDKGENVPLPLSEHTLFFDAKSASGTTLDKGRALAQKFAYLDQQKYVACDVKANTGGKNNNNDQTNCKQLNGASAFFDGGLVKLDQIGSYQVASTRNNDFSNRSQKARITVTPKIWQTWEIGLLIFGILLLARLLASLAVAAYAWCRPTSIMFSKKYRPWIIGCVMKRAWIERKIQIRKEWKQAEKLRWQKDIATLAGSDKRGSVAAALALQGKNKEIAGETTRPPVGSRTQCFKYGLRALGLLQGQRFTIVLFMLLNLIAFLCGFLLHFGEGFQGFIAFAIAKGAGFALDLDLAFLILPPLKSVQTALHGSGTKASSWAPLTDPIAFHITLAVMILFNSIIHIVAHLFLMVKISDGPVLQADPLGYYLYTTDENASGTALWQLFIIDRARTTGLIVTVLMGFMYCTAIPAVRRGTCCLARRCGGFRLFQRVHSMWPLVYLLLLIHGNIRFIIWMIFPLLMVLLDRLLLTQRQRYPGVLKSARILLFDVIHLTFEIPEGFSYQAGQYIMINWKGEWHPFTLTSAPEERYLTVHIRAPKTHDWCYALRRHLITEAPTSTAKGTRVGPDENLKEPAPGTTVKYDKVVLASGQLACCAKTLDGAITNLDEDFSVRLHGVVKHQTPPGEDTAMKNARADEGDSLVGADEDLPPGGVMLQIQGPFGAPAQKVWNFKTVMVVGAGIGVTPFVSILRSAQMRMQQQALLKSGSSRLRTDGIFKASPPESDEAPLLDLDEFQDAFLGHDYEEDDRCVADASSSSSVRLRREPVHGMFPKEATLQGVSPSVIGQKNANDSSSSKAKATRKDKSFDLPSVAPVGAGSDSDQLIEQLIKNVIPVPKKIHFYWIIRNQRELEWFYNLLNDALKGPAKDNIEVNLFTTGEVELSMVKKLQCEHHQWFGRPNWGRIFKDVKAQHLGDKIGVFLCGSPVIGTELAAQSAKNSDPHDFGPNRTRFAFFKEHF